MAYEAPKISDYGTLVELIPQEASGKYRFCISHVPHPSAAEGGRIAA